MLILSLIGVDRLPGSHRRPPVGASLLAIAVVPPTERVDVPPSSRAGSLPQVTCVDSVMGC
ncbi:hypothetical protein HNO91_21655 [Pseudomonas corrugata]|uniref:Uncharacterized protein n=1 Tax=Pseudomonas corrugata TaxID=47879 RepID=A0A7Y5Z8K2_9PSED|nr:hypothetical protein [Pseudomonas corrugata]NUT89043.1 hypothetical protein [Pseudomonas corrugata]